MPRFLALAAAIMAASAAVLPHDARAMGALVSSPPGASSAAEVHVALALGARGAPGATGATLTRTTRWVSLRIHGDATALAWVLPVRPGAFVDLASDGWLEALEAASAPRVVPPDVAPPSGIAAGVEVEGDLTHATTAAPDAAAVAPDGATLVTELGAWGLALPADVASAVDAAAAAGDAFVALRFTAAGGATAGADVRTRTVRITEDAPPDVAWSLAGLSLARGAGSAGDGASAPAVTVHVVADGPIAWGAPGADRSLALDPSAILWQPDGTSSYGAWRDALLRARPDGWLGETAGHGVLFQAAAVPDGSLLPSLAEAYFARASQDGDAAEDPAACTARALGVAARTSTVATACPPGALARVAPPATCAETAGAAGAGSGASEIAPDVLRCGGIADDLALALSGLAPSDAYLTRARSILTGGGADVSLRPAEPATTAEHGPVVVAAGYSLACAPDGGAMDPGGGGSTASGGGGGGGTVVGAAVGVGAGVTATSDTPPPDDSAEGCGGNSSDSDSGDSGGGCSGDTSSSSTDSSSSSDGCSGSHGSGGGGGGESENESGDSCGGSRGSESSSSSSDCSTARRGGARRSSPFSRVLLSLALAAGLFRRSRRRATRVDAREPAGESAAPPPRPPPSAG